jgi:flagellar biosynthesis/type III secretory pathway protein FliH
MSNVLQRVQTCEHAAIREDETMTPGGCVVNIASKGGGTGGSVDSSIETQLDRIAELLAPGVGGSLADDANGGGVKS